MGRFIQAINSKFSTHLLLRETQHFVGLHLHNFVQVKEHQTKVNQRKMVLKTMKRMKMNSEHGFISK